MKQVFSAHQLCEQDGPLGPYIESYDAEMRGEGYAQADERAANPFGRRFRLLVGQAWNPGAEHYRRVVPAVPSRASTTSTSDKKRSIRFAATAGVVEAARGGCGSGVASDDTGGAIAERISSLLATGTCARIYNAGGLHGVRQRVSDGALRRRISRSISAVCSGRYAIRAAACQHHPEQAGPVDDDRAEIVSTICALSGRHRQGFGCLYTSGGQLETVDPASRPSARPGRAGIELGGPENGYGPARLRDSLDPGTSGLARR